MPGYVGGVRVRRPSTAGRGAVLGALVAIVLSCGSIRDEELQCEEAVSRLEECCTNLSAGRFSCDPGCNSSVDLTERASACVRDRSCEELSSRGICTNMIRLANEPFPSSATAELEQEACK